MSKKGGKPGKGGKEEDFLEGTQGNDRLQGKQGDDVLVGHGGNDALDGGNGFDTVLYSGSFLDYSLAPRGSGLVVSDLRSGAPDGVDTLAAVEKVQFADFTLYLDGRNNAPYAVADTGSTTEDDSLVLSAALLVSNDRDFDGDALSITGVTLVEGLGSVELVDGNVVYDPGEAYQHLAAGETAAVILQYTVTDGRGGFDTAWVTVTVAGADDAPENRAPVAQGDGYALDEDGTLLVLASGVLANDTDADGDALSAFLDIGPAHGSLTLNADGSFTYTPEEDFAGEDSFTYRASDGTADSNTARVSIVVQAVNDAPVAADLTLAGRHENELVQGSLAGSASDVDGDTLTFRMAEGPKTKVKIGLQPDGDFMVDLSVFDGLDSGERDEVTFSYIASDGRADSEPATVTIEVLGVNDAPVALEQLLFTAEDSVLEAAASAFDPDDEPLTYTLVGGAPEGLDFRSDGTFSFDAGAGFQHLDTDLHGEVSFQYVASDGDAASEVATVTIGIAGVNDAPVTANQTFQADENATVIGSLAASTTDVDDSELTYAVVRDLSKPLFKLGAGGSFTLDLRAMGYDRLDDGESETFSFDYLANDGEADSNPSSVTVTVHGVNDAPVAADDLDSAADDEVAKSGNVLANDFDADVEPLAMLVNPGDIVLAHGTITVDVDGSYRYLVTDQSLGLGDTATEIFTYAVYDGSEQDFGELTFQLSGANDGPSANADTIGGAFSGQGPDSRSADDLLANDTDPDRGTVLELAEGQVLSALGATVTFTAHGYTYDASAVADLDMLPAELVMFDTFEYTVSDQDGGTASALAELSVRGRLEIPNNPPITMGDSFISNAMYAGGSGSLVPMEIPAAALLWNDTDPDFDTLALTAVGDATNGSVSLSGGTVTFTGTASLDIGPGPSFYFSDQEPNDTLANAHLLPRVAFGPDGSSADLARLSVNGHAGLFDVDWYAFANLRATEVLTIDLSASNSQFQLTDSAGHFITGPLSGSFSFVVPGDGTYGLRVTAPADYQLNAALDPVEKFEFGFFGYTVSDGQAESQGFAFIKAVQGNFLQGTQSGPEVLMGSDGADTIFGDFGNDLLIGGAGSDRFLYTLDGQGWDIISDFERGFGGDVIDLSIATDYVAGVSHVSDYVQIQNLGPGAWVRVDYDGRANGLHYQDLAFLEGQTGLFETQMLAEGNLFL